MQHGRNIMVFQDGTIIAGTRTNKIQVGCEVIEIANPSSGLWKEFVAGRVNWSISTGFLIPAVSDIRKVLNVGNTYTLQFRDRTGAAVMTGSAILKDAEIDAQIGNLATGSFVFQGTGALV